MPIERCQSFLEQPPGRAQIAQVLGREWTGMVRWRPQVASLLDETDQSFTILEASLEQLGEMLGMPHDLLVVMIVGILQDEVAPARTPAAKKTLAPAQRQAFFSPVLAVGHAHGVVEHLAQGEFVAVNEGGGLSHVWRWTVVPQPLTKATPLFGPGKKSRLRPVRQRESRRVKEQAGMGQREYRELQTTERPGSDRDVVGNANSCANKIGQRRGRAEHAQGLDLLHPVEVSNTSEFESQQVAIGLIVSQSPG